MLETPQIVDSTAQHTACIHLTVPRSAIQKEMDAAIEEILASLGDQSIEPDGPLIAHHLRIDPATFDVEVGFPIATQVMDSGRVRPGHIPASRVVRSTYAGPYEGLQDAWRDLNDWIRSQGLTMGPNAWEVFVRGPESGDGPSEWRTELNRPIVS